MKNKFIIISTCYNKGKWVQNLINSLKSQSNQNFKAYFGYDKSTDNTLDYLVNAIGDDKNQYKIIHNKGKSSLISSLSNFDYIIQFSSNFFEFESFNIINKLKSNNDIQFANFVDSNSIKEKYLLSI